MYNFKTFDYDAPPERRQHRNAREQLGMGGSESELFLRKLFSSSLQKPHEQASYITLSPTMESNTTPEPETTPRTLLFDADGTSCLIKVSRLF